MCLLSWRGDNVRKQEVLLLKTCLKKEIKSLDQIVTMYLDNAENQAERQQPMYVKD